MSVVAQRVSSSRPRVSGSTKLRYYSAQNVPLLFSLGMLGVMIVLYVVLFTIRQGHTPGNFELTSTVSSTLSIGLAAMGQTLVVLTGGIDLSVGGTVDLANAMAANYMNDSTASMILVSLLVIGTGALVGLVNGLLVTLGRLQPIVVTLGTLAILQGIALYVLPTPGGQIPLSLTNLLSGTIPSLANFPCGLVVVLLLIVLWLVLRHTPLMAAIYAVGNDARAARASGIPVLRAKLGAFVLGGAFSGAAGLYFAAANTSGDAVAGNGFTLTSIAAVVLGGVSLMGGRGSAIGSLAGAFILTLILNVLFFSNINPQLQSFFVGLFLILAVVASTLIRRLVLRGR